MVTNTTGATTETEWIDTGEKRDALGRRHTPRERRAELLAEFKASGLTQSAFARREGINYTTFCSWAQAERQAGRLAPARAGRQRRRETPAGAAPVRFAAVPLPASLSASGGRLHALMDSVGEIAECLPGEIHHIVLIAVRVL